MDTQECRPYRGIVGSLQYLSIDRFDVQFETNACAIDMKQPTRASWTRLKRLARYLAGTQAAKVVLMRHGADRDAHEAFFCESGSTVIGLGVPRTEKVNRVLKLKLMVSRCIPHQARAHSSSEAEYYAAVSATSEAMLIREVLLFLGLEVRTELLLNSAAARGICRREGVGTIYVICQRKFFGYSSW